MAFEYNGVVYRDLEPQVRYDAEQVQLLKQADATINENLQTVNESLQTVNTEIDGKLTKPANPSAESAVTLLADGTVGTKLLSELVSPVVDKPYELIEEITITEDMAYTQSHGNVVIKRTSEPNGTTYNFKKLFVKICYDNVQTVDIDTTLEYGGRIYAENAGQNRIGLYCLHKIRFNGAIYIGDYYNFWVENGRSNARGEYWSNESLSNNMHLLDNTFLSPLDKIASFTFHAQLPKGAIVYIYGVRA